MNSVDLPAPLGPMRPTISSSPTERSTSARTCSPPKLLETLSKRRTSLFPIILVLFSYYLGHLTRNQAFGASLLTWMPRTTQLVRTNRIETDDSSLNAFPFPCLVLRLPFSGKAQDQEIDLKHTYGRIKQNSVKPLKKPKKCIRFLQEVG